MLKLPGKFGSHTMAKAKDVKKGLVVALEGGYWIVEEFHSQHQGRRGRSSTSRCGT
jgi:translation elongation factor P/translation initiation factor 5A